ncbi:MAG TPA: hypothetical protein VI408_13180 [Gaiellaceae bacterium]
MRLVACLAAAAALAAATGAGASPPPHFTFRYVAFVTLTGEGTVLSAPRGIDCPRSCRWAFVRGTTVHLRASAAPGWKFAGFSSKWCNGPKGACVMNLVSPHDCVGGACPLGAFGVRALFVKR